MAKVMKVVKRKMVVTKAVPASRAKANKPPSRRIPGQQPAVSKKPRSVYSVPKALGKIRVGVIWGKVFDPIRVGAQDRDYPEKMKIKNNTGPKAAGWGGQFQSDVNTGLKIARQHPDIFHIDFMSLKDVSEARLAKNHLNFNFWGDASIALMEVGQKKSDELVKVQKNPDCRHVPEWEEYEWITVKPMYMKTCMKAGIPMIDTIFVDKGFNAKAVLKQVQEKGWDKFLVKPAYMSFFSQGIFQGVTQEVKKDMKPLLEYEKDVAKNGWKMFLVQPYVLKPNGNVFDEIRNFLINGEWAYSVYTDGTDDEAVYEQPAGPLKEAAKQLTIRTYAEVQKVAKWAGVPVHTLLTRIDIGITPDPLIVGGWRMFVNEIEPQAATWLGRYCPFENSDRMATACVAQIRRRLKISLAKGRKLPNAEQVKALLEILDGRLGPVPMD